MKQMKEQILLRTDFKVHLLMEPTVMKKVSFVPQKFHKIKTKTYKRFIQ